MKKSAKQSTTMEITSTDKVKPNHGVGGFRAFWKTVGRLKPGQSVRSPWKTSSVTSQICAVKYATGHDYHTFTVDGACYVGRR